MADDPTTPDSTLALDIKETLTIADYVYVLELGKNKFEGAPSDFDDLEKAFWVG